VYIASGHVYAKNGLTALADYMDAVDSTYTQGHVFIGGVMNLHTFDWLEARTSHEIKCYGLPTGWKFQVTDGTTNATATESSGVATVDAGLVLFPCTEVRVLNGSDVEQTHTLSATIADIGGGDEFFYAPNQTATLASSDILVEWS